MIGAELILAALLVFAPWGEGGATPGALAVIHSGILLLAVAVLWKARRAGTLRVRMTWPVLTFGLFTAWGGLSFLRADYLYASFDTWWEQCALLILLLSLSAIGPGARFRALLPMIIVGLGTAQAVPAVLTRITEGATFSPSFLNPNHLAAYLNLSVLVALHGAGWLGGGARDEAPGKGRPVWILCGLLCLAGTVAVGSRGGLLALVAVLGLVSLKARIPWPRLARRLAVVVLLVAAAGALSVGLRFSAQVDPYRYDRPRLWTTALKTWSEAPVMGHGPGMYDHRAPAHNFPQENAAFRYSKQPRSAHSQPLQVLAEEGAVGLALLGLFVVTWAAALYGSGREGRDGGWSRCTLLASAVVALHSMVEMPFSVPALPLTLVAMGWVALHRHEPGEAAAGFTLPWPVKGLRMGVDLPVAAAVLSVFAIAVAGPWLSYRAAHYAESPGRAPVRIDLAARLSERFNPWQPFLGLRRAEAALARVASVSPPLLANASESLERTVRLAPGDPSAHVLMGSLYRRAALDLPGAGPGALAGAERHMDRALELAPLDARIWIDRAVLRLMTGRGEEALSDLGQARELEPRSLMAAHLRLEALVALGRMGEAREALSHLDELSVMMEGYQPLNPYERSLLRLDRGRVRAVRDRLTGSALVPPA